MTNEKKEQQNDGIGRVLAKPEEAMRRRWPLPVRFAALIKSHRELRKDHAALQLEFRRSQEHVRALERQVRELKGEVAEAASAAGTAMNHSDELHEKIVALLDRIADHFEDPEIDSDEIVERVWSELAAVE